jgi:hypothetical protein
MKVGVIIGAASGKGTAPETIVSLADRLRACEVAVCGGMFGCGALPPGWSRLTAWPSVTQDLSGGPLQATAYVKNLYASVASLLEWGAEILVCIGGDGLCSYVLDAMITRERESPAPSARGTRVPLLGIASGTINVGPVIAFGPGDIPRLDLEALVSSSRKSIDAVEVCVDGRHLAFGLNDVVVGNSFLGTLGGEVVNISARELLHSGRKLKIEPSAHIVGENFRLRKNGEPIAVSMESPAQIIVSPLRRREFFGRAIAGVLCNAAFMEGAAAMGLFDTVIVRAAAPLRGFIDTARAEHLLFGPGDQIEIEGLGPDAHIIVDGNPYERGGEVVRFCLRPDIAEALVPTATNSAGQEGAL